MSKKCEKVCEEKLGVDRWVEYEYNQNNNKF